MMKNKNLSIFVGAILFVVSVLVGLFVGSQIWE